MDHSKIIREIFTWAQYIQPITQHTQKGVTIKMSKGNNLWNYKDYDIYVELMLHCVIISSVNNVFVDPDVYEFYYYNVFSCY